VAHDPEVVGPYRLLGRLGAGGMGQVYLGLSPVGEQVAVKVVHPGLAHDDRFRARFRREVEVGRSVSGPWVAAILDADPAATVPWLATEYVPGPGLDRAVDQLGPLPEPVVHTMAAGLARALAGIHGVGLVHRDVKPSNVLLGADRPRLIDFGISRATEGTRMTTTGMVVGTPAFMSPEQAIGDDVGTASDVFSLGGVIVYALTGQAPFGDAAPVVLLMRISDHEPDLSAVPVSLLTAVRACLAKEPASRPSAAELVASFDLPAPAGPGWLPASVAALASAAFDAATRVGANTRVAGTRQVTRPGTAQTRTINRRAVLAGVGVIAAAGAGVLLLSRQPPVASTTTEPAPVPTASTAQVLWSHRAPDHVTGVHRAGGMLLVETRSVVQALDASSGAVRWTHELDWSAGSNGFKAVSVDETSGLVAVASLRSLVLLDARTGGLRTVLSAAGNPIAGAEAHIAGGVVHAAFVGTVAAFDAESGRERWRQESSDIWESSLAVAEGRCFVHAGGGIEAFDTSTGGPLWRYDTPGPGEIEIAAAGGGVYLMSRKVGRVVAVDAATGAERWQINHGTADGETRVPPAVGLVVNGDLVHVAGNDRRAYALDAATGTNQWTALDVSADGAGADHGFAAAGREVYVGSEGGRIHALDATTGARKWTYTGRPEDAMHITPNHDVLFVSRYQSGVEALRRPTE
jgi:eukaryotic-like serine/threonine-protein kinase